MVMRSIGPNGGEVLPRWVTGLAGLITFGGVLMSACTAPEIPEPSLAQRARKECVSRTRDDFYFPFEAINPQNAVIDESERNAYSQFLGALNQPSLSCGDDVTEAYRFLWMPTYRPAAVILVARTGKGWRVDAAQFNHPRTNQPWTVARRVEHGVAEDQVRDLLTSLARAQFWTIATWHDSFVNDGSTWVIEGRLRTGYRVVSRLNPRDEAFKDAGRAFFSLAGMTVPPEAKR
jgi:hypothetical protein